jgi:acyl CoA:acetate/3-ketoacid CoA transferase beta subunit
VITDLAVLDAAGTAFHLVELAPGVTIAKMVAKIGSAVTADWER